MMQLGLLVAGHIPGELSQMFPGYPEMFRNLLGQRETGIHWENFDVYKDIFPDSPDDCDAWIISGSQFSAWQAEPWMEKLGGFIQDCHKKKRKLLGICFGHQIIAHYLGGLCEPAPSGWGIGYREFPLLARPPWVASGAIRLKLSYSHQDQVTRLPPAATLHGSTPFCPIESFSMGSHIFSVQGHPEFSLEYARTLWNLRAGLYPPGLLKSAVDSEPILYPNPDLITSLREFLAFK